MIQKVHEHIVEELKTNTRTDTIFILAAIFLNLISLGVNAGVAAGSRGESDSFTPTVVMFTFVALIIVINIVAEIGLIRGRQTRTKLINGLIKMYKDNGVEGYYDPSLLEAYKTRYNLFMMVVLFTGLVALIIPFIIR